MNGKKRKNGKWFDRTDKKAASVYASENGYKLIWRISFKVGSVQTVEWFVGSPLPRHILKAVNQGDGQAKTYPIDKRIKAVTHNKKNPIK